MRLDGLDARDASGLRDDAAARPPAADAAARRRAAGARPRAPPRPPPPPPAPAETEIARLRLAWLRYAPFTLSGVADRRRHRGFLLHTANDAHLDPRDLGAVGDAGDALGGTPLVLAIVVVAVLAVVLLVAVCSTAGTRSRSGAIRLTRHPGGTIHVTRGLLSTRATTIEERRLRGVELSEPLLLRWAGGARCDAIATGLGIGRGAERGGRRCSRPARGSVAARVAGDVLRTGVPVTAPLTPHGPRARTRRYTRALGAAPCSSPSPSIGAIAASSLAGHRCGRSPSRASRSPPRSPPTARGASGTRSRRPRSSTRAGSLVRRRAMLSREGIIGITLRRSFFQRRAGLCTLTATTAAGRQAYAVTDVPDDEALRVCDAAVPGLLDVFRAGRA